MDEQVSGEGGRWDAPAAEQRDAARGRVRGEASDGARRGGVKMKWIFTWLVASAIAIFVLRHIDMVERFEEGLTREQEQSTTLSSDDDLDRESEAATHKKAKRHRVKAAPEAPPLMNPSDMMKGKSY